METLKTTIPPSQEVVDYQAKVLYGEQSKLHELRDLITEVEQKTKSRDAKVIAAKMLGRVVKLNEDNLRTAQTFAGEHTEELKEQAIRDAEAEGIELLNVDEPDVPLGIDTGKIRTIIEQTREYNTPTDPAVEARIKIIDEYCNEHGISSLELRAKDMKVIQSLPEWKELEETSV